MQLAVATYNFLNELSHFSYTLSSLDRVWDILFSDEANRWHHLRVNTYKDTFFVTHISGGGGCLEVEPDVYVRVLQNTGISSYSDQNRSQADLVWEPLIRSACSSLKVVRKEWIKANKQI